MAFSWGFAVGLAMAAIHAATKIGYINDIGIVWIEGRDKRTPVRIIGYTLPCRTTVAAGPESVTTVKPGGGIKPGGVAWINGYGVGRFRENMGPCFAVVGRFPNAAARGCRE